MSKMMKIVNLKKSLFGLKSDQVKLLRARKRIVVRNFQKC